MRKAATVQAEQPDQLSALVTTLGPHNSEALNTIAPFGAACQSIVYAVGQIEKERPMAVMGLFDISQRHMYHILYIPADFDTNRKRFLRRRSAEKA